MAFRFAARTIIELGKELISSDEVALYELIKNSIDAQSKKVEIILNVCLKSSDYREAIARIREEKRSRADVIGFLRGVLIDDCLGDPRTWLTDLCDATSDDAFLHSLEALYDKLNYVEVRDTGHGMAIDELSDVFLRIGTSSRRKDNLAGARHLGDKGIGRLSAMRLGDRLQVKTARESCTCWNVLDIDWGRFSRDEDADVDAIELQPAIGEEKANPKDSGTTIRISTLHGDWDRARFADILQGKIARMVDPFVEGLANRLIVVRHNGTRLLVPSIPPALLRAAHAVCHVDFQITDGVPALVGEIDYRHRHRKRIIAVQGAEVLSVAQRAVKRRAKRGHAAYKLLPIRLSTLESLGPFHCDVYWYNRKVVDAIDGLTTRATDTRREISNWSGGPMLYRYGFRVLPYGDPDDDWLALDEWAFGESGFKLNRQQVIGRVLLNTPHHLLREQTNRQGLVDSEVAGTLRKILQWLVHSELRGLINEADEVEFMQRRVAERNSATLSRSRKRVDAALGRLRASVGETAKEEIDEVAAGVGRLSVESEELLTRIEAVIEEADEERGKFVYLAGIGLMTEFIFHELERAVAHTIDLISRGGLRRATVESLRDQLVTLHKRIAAFDELTGEKRQRKSSFDLGTLVAGVLDNHQQEFVRHGVRAQIRSIGGRLVVKAVRGMAIQIVENLLVNAAYWLKQQKGFEPGFEPSLTIVVDGDAKRLTVEDNGPGVIEDRRERIFQPFVTTKPAGQGRGLGLYIARDMASYHGWKLGMDDDVGLVRKGRVNRFVLDMVER